jgi:peptide/nickel transport system permease protein
MNYRYIFRRILLFIPSLFAISLISFIISINAPGDPVEAFFEGAKTGRSGTLAGNKIESDKKALRHELGLDLPAFYVTMTSLAKPDTFYKIGNAGERENLERLIDRYGNWPQISVYYYRVRLLRDLIGGENSNPQSDSIKQTIDRQCDALYEVTLSLLLTNNEAEIESKLNFLKLKIDSIQNADNYLDYVSDIAAKCNTDFAMVKSSASVWKTFVPTLHFYGNNQYHRWFFGDGNMFTGNGSQYCEGVIRGDFGKSYSTGLPVTETISRALPWSVFFTFVAVLLAYIISIPIGVKAASKRGSLFDRTSSVILFMLHSFPPFLMGIVLMVLFANPDNWNIFPSNGVEPTVGIDSSLGWWDRTMIRLPYFILPVICYTYSSLAFLSRTVRVAMLEVNTLDFMRTARAKGLSGRMLFYRHGLSNALLPIITVFANIFPAAIGGSVVLEYLFGIPGMGTEILAATQAGDFSMIVAVFTLAGFMTLIGYLIADILYSLADPRISFEKK